MYTSFDYLKTSPVEEINDRIKISLYYVRFSGGDALVTYFNEGIRKNDENPEK